MEDAFFEKNFQCLLCDTKFKELRVKRSRLKVKKVDTDFANHTEGPNTIHYTVSVCPSCGFSFTPQFASPSERLRNALKKIMVPPSEDLSGKRTHEQVVYSFQRALCCSYLTFQKYNVKAALFLQLAWVHRFAEEEDDELFNLENALDNFVMLYEEDTEIEQVARTMYLVGELNRRLGNEREAVKWFSMLINNHKNKSPQLAKVARERWQEIREVKEEKDLL